MIVAIDHFLGKNGLGRANSTCPADETDMQKNVSSLLNGKNTRISKMPQHLPTKTFASCMVTCI